MLVLPWNRQYVHTKAVCIQKETRVAQLEVFTIIGTTVKIYTLNK